jgi:hypothetical protein
MAAPVYVAPERTEDETNLQYGLRVAAAKRKHRAALRRWRDRDPNVSVEKEAEAAEPEKEKGRLEQYGEGLRGDIEEQMKKYEE